MLVGCLVGPQMSGFSDVAVGQCPRDFMSTGLGAFGKLDFFDE